MRKGMQLLQRYQEHIVDALAVDALAVAALAIVVFQHDSTGA